MVSNAIGYVVYLCLTWAGVGAKAAMTLLYCTSVITGFFGNRKWSFSHRGPKGAAAVRYVSAHAVGYGLNFAILAFFVDRLRYPHRLVQAGAILAVAAYLFVAFRFFVFPRAAEPGGQE